MDLLKSQFDRIQQQLAGLSASQKMLAACLVVIIVMTIGWWGRYAAVPEMEAVNTQPLSSEDLQAVRAQLRSSGIPSQVVDGKVEVPTDRFAEALADLTFSQALPKSTKFDFQALVKDMNPFTPQSTTDAQFNHYTQLRLAEVIAKFPGVQSAEVFIDATERIKMGGGILPSATVSVQMKRGETVTQRLIDAAGHFIAASHAALSWQRVRVIVNGQLHRVRDPESGGGSGGGEARQLAEQYEKDVEDKVRQHFSYIPQMTVSVSFKVAMDTKRTQSHIYDKDNVIHKPIDEIERTSESTNPAPGAGGDVGAQPNFGMSIASSIDLPSLTSPANDSDASSTGIGIAGMATVASAGSGLPLRTIMDTMNRLTTARPPSRISRECAPATAATEAVENPAAVAAPNPPPAICGARSVYIDTSTASGFSSPTTACTVPRISFISRRKRSWMVVSSGSGALGLAAPARSALMTLAM